MVSHAPLPLQVYHETNLLLCLGFAVVGEYADANIEKAQQLAFNQMLGWLNRF